MRFRDFALSVALLLFGVVYTGPHERAYAVVSSGSNVASALANEVVAWSEANGISILDPRLSATIEAMKREAAVVGAEAAAGMGTAAGSASWLAVAAYGGVAALLAGAPTSLGKGDDLQWQFNSDGTITLTRNGSSSGASSPYGGVLPGQIVWCQGTGGVAYPNGVCGSSLSAAAQAWVQFETTKYYTASLTSCATSSCSFVYTPTDYGKANGDTIALHDTQSFSSGTWPSNAPSCQSGLYVAGCASYGGSQPALPAGPVALPTAVGLLTPTEQQDEVQPQVLADLGDALWQQAAQQPGYAGLPYPVNNPITTDIASGVESQMGTSAPTVGSLTSPASSSSSTDPATIPMTPTSPSGASEPLATPTNPGSGAEVNLGPDPGIGAPDLENIPTAAQILQPILSLFSDLRSWAVPAHTSQCPEPSFSLWGQTYSITSQCVLLDQNAAVIHGAFVLAFSIAVLLVVLSA